MKTLLATVAVCSALIGFIPAASGQGTVTFTPITSQSQLTPYQGQAAWTLLLDVQHGGGYLFTDTTTNGFSPSLNAAYSASVLLSESGGTVSASDQILNGRFGSTGATASTSISSLTPLSGVLIYTTDAFPDWGGATVSDLYVGSNYQPTVADTTSGATFGGGILCSFSDPTTSLNNLAFTVNQPNGGAGEKIFVIGLEANAVPEPSTLALAGLGGLALLMAVRRKK